MNETSAFRTLLIAQWIIPFVSVGFDLWLGPSADDALSTNEAPLFEQTFSIGPSWLTWVSIPLVLTAIVATVGLYRFRSWAPRLYGIALALYAGFVIISDPVTLAGPSQLLFFLDAAICGAIATWLLVARDRLPFPRRTVV